MTPTPAAAGVDPDPLTDEHYGVPAADLAEAELPLVLDAGDVQPDLIDVPDDGEPRTAARSGTRANEDPTWSAPTSRRTRRTPRATRGRGPSRDRTVRCGRAVR